MRPALSNDQSYSTTKRNYLHAQHDDKHSKHRRFDVTSFSHKHWLKVKISRFAAAVVALVVAAAVSVVPATQQAAAQQPAAGSVSFDPSDVSLSKAVDRVWTVGVRVDQHDASLPDGGLDFLPEAIVMLPRGTLRFELAYSATGLPAGLTVGNDRVIRGIPSAATNGEITVTFTATGKAFNAVGEQIGETSTASLQFQVEVKKPPVTSVTFDPASLTLFTNNILEYTIGQANPLNVLNVKFPRATGGEGPLKYWLDNKELPVPISNYAKELSFDPAVPALTSSISDEEPVAGQSYALIYWAEDSKGTRAIAHGSVVVAAAPKIPASEILKFKEKAFTVGQPVSITLPEATGGSKRVVSLRYRVDGLIPGLQFNPRTRTLSGTPTHTGQARFTYTVTDRNDVSDSAKVALTFNAGPSAPTETPRVTARAIDSGDDTLGSLLVVDWADVNGATNYVVHVRASNGAYFPLLSYDSVPDQGKLYKCSSRSQNEDGTMTRAVVHGLPNGTYQVRVAAENADGAGPRSYAITVTLPGVQKLAGIADACRN